VLIFFSDKKNLNNPNNINVPKPTIYLTNFCQISTNPLQKGGENAKLVYSYSQFVKKLVGADICQEARNLSGI
jgi:hypothetical protein